MGDKRGAGQRWVGRIAAGLQGQPQLGAWALTTQALLSPLFLLANVFLTHVCPPRHGEHGCCGTSELTARGSHHLIGAAMPFQV